MSSKADYLKKYLSAEDKKDTKPEKKRRKKIKKRPNLAIHDDDVDWRSLVPKDQPETEESEESDEAPQVAEYKDESVQIVNKWQPLGGNLPSDDGDLSPPRHSGRRRMDSPDLSPPRGGRRLDSDTDLSPPRKRKHTSRTEDSRSKRSKKRHDSPEILERGPVNMKQTSIHSSPLRRKRHDSVDNSPPQRQRHDSDNSPPQRVAGFDDNSPPQRKRHDSVDNSPPRRKRHDSDNSPPRRVPDSVGINPLKKSDLSPPRKKAASTSKDKDRMSSGARAGLQNAQALKEENEMVRRRQEDFFKSLDPSVSGRHAETVYRDKQGKKVDPKMEKLIQREKEREMEEENEKFMKWGRGAAQTQSYEEKLEEDLYEMSKPLARYADDEDLEKMLKARERAGDPMLAFLKKPTPSSSKSNKKAKKERPTYKGSFPPNRYGIKPGYRWDGVNRSNGFEKTWFARESNKVAVAEEAYKWSVEDM